MAEKIKSFAEFHEKLLNDPEMVQKFKEDPIKAAGEIKAQHPLSGDNWIYRIVVSCIGLTLLFIVIGSMILFANGIFKDEKEIPTLFTAIASGALGALAGLLAPSPTK